MFGIGKNNMNMNPDYYQIQRAKEDYVLLHDHFVTHPHLLDDLTTRCLYNSLMAVVTPKDLDQWLDAIAKTDLSLANAPQMSSGVSWENVLGRFELLVRKMMGEERTLLAKGMVDIRKGGYEHYFNRDIVTLFSDAEKAKKVHPDSIVILSDQIDNHVAVGNDADKLFERFGWQTATAIVDGKRKSVMPICDDIMRTNGMFDYHLLETMVDMLDIRLSDPMEAQLSIAQQTIDAFRKSVPKEKIVFPLVDVRCDIVKHGIEHDYHYPFAEKSGDTFSVFRSDARRETVVSGQSWNVSIDRIPMLTSLAEYLYVLMHDMVKRDNAIGMGGIVSCDMRSIASFEEYTMLQKRNPGKRLLVDHGHFCETYQDNAVSLAREFHLSLWSRDCGMYGETTMLILSPQMAGYVTDLCDDVEIVKGQLHDRLGKMRLRPSVLNGFLELEDVFQDASVFVKKDGNYAVRASRDGTLLPMRGIPRNMGDQYMALSDGLAKKVCLNGILHSAYCNVSQDKDYSLTLQMK